MFIFTIFKGFLTNYYALIIIIIIIYKIKSVIVLKIEIKVIHALTL